MSARQCGHSSSENKENEAFDLLGGLFALLARRWWGQPPPTTTTGPPSYVSLLRIPDGAGQPQALSRRVVLLFGNFPAIVLWKSGSWSAKVEEAIICRRSLTCTSLSFGRAVVHLWLLLLPVSLVFC